MHQCDKDKVTDNIRYTGDCDKNQRQSGVAQTAENTADDIVCDDKHDTAAADADIQHRQLQRLRRCLHQRCNLRGKQHQNNGQNHSGVQEKADHTADDIADSLFTALADIAADEYRDAHRQTGYHKRDQIDNVASGRDRRDAGCRAEPSHHQQIHRAVHRLKDQRAEYRNHKPQQFGEDFPLCEVSNIFISFHVIVLSLLCVQPISFSSDIL